MPPLSLFVPLYALAMPDRRSPPVVTPEKKPRDLQHADNWKALFDYTLQDRIEAGNCHAGAATDAHQEWPRQGRDRSRARQEALREAPGDQGTGGRPRDAGGHPSQDLAAEGRRALADLFRARPLACLERNFLEEE